MKSTNLSELLYFAAEQSAPAHHQPQLAADDGAADAPEEDAVQEARAHAAAEVAELLRVREPKEELLEPAGLRQLLEHGLAQTLEHHGHARHYGRLEHAQVALLALPDRRRVVRDRLRRRVADADAV